MATKRSRRRRNRQRLTILIAAVVVILGIVITIISVNAANAAKLKLRYKEYPLRYKDAIMEYAAEYGLEPEHVAAVIRCESSFDPKALSDVGARGLMQLMPDTGVWAAQKLKQSDVYEDSFLYEPEINIEYGCWYLNWLMDRYDRNMLHTTAAYHAGFGEVDKWLQDPVLCKADGTLDPDKIPFDTTRVYVGRIFKAYDNYKELYDFDTEAA